MNTLIKIITTLIIAAISSFAKANDLSKIEKPNNHAIIVKYIDLIQNGTYSSAKDIFSDDLKQNIYTESENKSISKNDLLRHLKNTKNLKMNCKTDFKLIDHNNNTSIVKVVLQFENFKRIDYLTLYKKNENWKIQEINTSYN